MEQKFDVTGMTCSACSAHVEKAVRKVPGVSKVTVNLLSNHMAVEYDENTTNANEIIQSVEQAGYGASVHGAQDKKVSVGKEKDPMAEQIAEMKRRLIFSFCFMIPLMYVSMGHMAGLPLPGWLHGTENAMSFALTQFLLTLPVVYLNRKYYQVGFKTLFKGAPNMDSLIAIGSAAAMIYGIFALYQIGYGLGHGDMGLVSQYSMDLYFESAAMILTLITLGKFLETRSKGKTSEAITKLMDLAPKTALVERDGEEQEIPVESVRVGDLVIVKPGQSVPVDGEIVDGASAVDESAITGESIPVEKHPGDAVIAATINRSGWFKFRATKVGGDTTLAQIIALVEEAANSKAPIAKLADQVSGIFVPVVISIAVLATVVWLLLGYSVAFALSIGISVLVISCPCALGLATPVAIMVGTGKGAENGILIKSAESLETAHTIDTVVLDKTGTITQGKPRVTDIITVPGVEQNLLLSAAASVEKPSEHPLAEAIVQEAMSHKLPLRAAKEFSAVPGQGVRANLGGKVFLAGNLRMMQECQVPTMGLEQQGERLSQQGKTPLYFAADGHLMGLIGVADTVKPTSKAAIEVLKEMGIRVVMLTGDNQRTAEAIRQQLGIDTAIAEVLPQDKERMVAQFQQEGSGHRVAMVGDGINDAPALTRADVGIAIGAGTDVAIESADIVLMKSDLLDVVTAIQLSKAVIRNIKENLFWAFFYNSIGIPLAAGVFFLSLGLKLNPMFGAAAMSLSSVCVVSNALRLKLFKPRWKAVEPVAEEPSAVCVAEIKQPESPAEKGVAIMELKMSIEGMMCQHCAASVERALNSLDGVGALVDLQSQMAYIQTEGKVSDSDLINAVETIGYQVLSID